MQRVFRGAPGVPSHPTENPGAPLMQTVLARLAIITALVVVGGCAGLEALLEPVLPAELDSMARTLRRLGFDRQVDQLEVAMNRAAEEASGEAREVLWLEIRERFHPIVVAKMQQVGLSRLYGELAESYNRLPLVSRPAIDLDAYVTARALAGLFVVLGEEEAKIRRDRVARTTELLRRVFGAADGPVVP